MKKVTWVLNKIDSSIRDIYVIDSTDCFRMFNVAVELCPVVYDNKLSFN